MSKEKKETIEEQVIEEQVEEIEEQYRILKDEEEKEEKRKIFLLLTLFFMVFAISFAGASFSYITFKNANNKKNNEEIKEGNNGATNPEDLEKESMQVLFTSGAEFIAEDVTPGWESSASKEFEVKNTGTLDAMYSIKFKDIKNNFENLEDLTYTLVCNKEKIIENGKLPKENTIVLSGEKIKVGETKTYEIYFKYAETGKNQSNDASKTYKMSVDVTNEEK